jgi:hypothetical protein
MQRWVKIFAFLVATSMGASILSFAAEAGRSIPAGTSIEATLTTLLTTKTSEEGDPFMAKVVEPVFVKGEQIVPAGSTLEGHVAFVKDPGRVKGKAEMRLVADRILTPDSWEYTLAAGLQDASGAEGAKVTGEEGTVQGPGKSVKHTAKESAIDAGIGAGVGAIAAGGTGSLYGLGIGAIAGVLHNVGKKHKDLVLPQGTDLTFVVNRDIPGKPSTEEPPMVLSQ